MNDERLIALETKLAFQEETLRVLNEVVTEQQARIERLEQVCRQLAERVARSGDGSFKELPGDELPPHY